MSRFLRIAAPRSVAVIDQPSLPLEAGQTRVRTIYSGISAGTELTAYRGTNPYLTSTWDAEARLFQPGQEALGYPFDGWGYSEVGEVVELAPPEGQPAGAAGNDAPVRAGDVVWGIWGHRDEGVLAADSLRGHVLPEGMDPLAGAFVRVGAIALSAVLAADLGPGSTVAIELSGNYRALHEATRAVGADGTVIAAGFYQGEAAGVRFGEEFHHNRVQLLASQIGSVPNRLRSRWTVPRLQQTVVDHLADSRVNAPALVTHTFSLADSAKAYELLDTDLESALQVVLEFP